MSVTEKAERSEEEEKLAIRNAFESYYPKLANISMRYGKDDEQAEAMIHYGFYHFICKIRKQFRNTNFEDLIGVEFIRQCIRYVKELRSEYFVSSTVHVKSNQTEGKEEEISYPEMTRIEKRVLVETIRRLPPAQRLVYNLVIIEGFDLKHTAELLESSQESVKFNLEKARINFKKQLLLQIRSHS